MSSESLFSDLEIGLHHWQPNRYTLDLRFTPPGSDSDERLVCDGERAVRLDLAARLSNSLDDVEYGRVLTNALLADAEARSIFDRARQAADSRGVPLRLRLFVNPNASELHGVQWERLLDPSRNAPLLTGEHVFFSRYLSSRDWTPAGLRPKTQLRGLVVVANPTDLGIYTMPPVDVEGELTRARQALGDIELVELASGGASTLSNLVDHLRDGDGFDIFYLVCHGKLVDGEPWLFLEKTAEQGNGDGAAGIGPSPVVIDRVSGAELATRIAELRQRPRLAVLASCQSAGTAEEKQTHERDLGVLAATGPKLAEVGIPAVVAMQGDLTMKTAAQFMPRFFRELMQDGQIDRAMSIARGEVRERPDWWVPVLFMRLRSGRIWYAPGFGEAGRLEEKWPSIIHNIQDGVCVPILGPGLAESLLGSQREMARKWADQYHFPMAPEDREDLPQVAQFLAVNQQPLFPRKELGRYLREELIGRLQALLDVNRLEHLEQYQNLDLKQCPLDDLITSVAHLRQLSDPTEPHLVLARLPLKIFITTDASSLLAKALEKADKHPVEEFCRWNDEVEWAPSIYTSEPNYVPSESRPLVYHLFGRLDEPESLVITEDDYFDFLIGATRRSKLIPKTVRSALTDSGLLFLGFRLEDWDFRVLFRTLMQQQGKSRRARYAHVAAQVDPEEGRIQEPERARQYLQSYFQGPEIKIDLFWGTVENFTRELQQRWKA